MIVRNYLIVKVLLVCSSKGRQPPLYKLNLLGTALIYLWWDDGIRKLFIPGGK